MKLSKAIRKGIELSPEQHIGSFFPLKSTSKWTDKTWHYDTSKSCVLGAAFLGSKTLLKNYKTPVYMEAFPDLFIDGTPITITSMMNGYPTDVFSAAVEMNDYCGWTREEIAEYLETYGL